MISQIITRLVGWAAARFYRLDIEGEPFPDGPVLVVANHPNALLDPIIVFRTARRVVRPLAKEPLFHHPLIGPVLTALGGLPVYRKQDHPELMHQNEKTFDAAIAALHAGDAVQIYPEGQSHSELRVNPLKTGAARIALRAEEQANWKLGLRIVPIGLTYTRKGYFRGRAASVTGASFDIISFRGLYDVDNASAVHALTDEIAKRIEQLTLVLSNTEDVALIDTAERLYTREKGIATWREAEGLGTRLPRMQAFAQGMAWLRAHDPQRHERLAMAVKTYRRQAELLGATDGDVPPRYDVASVIRYAAREALVLGVGLPLALAALIFWYPPYALNAVVMKRLRVDETGMATHKLGLAIVLMPLVLVAWVTIAAVMFGWSAAAVAIVVLPILGLILQGWSGRLEKVTQDTALFLRVVANPEHGDQLARQRKVLVAEFDDILAVMTRKVD